MIAGLEDLAEEVGRAILPLFTTGDFATRTKSDASPVTEADILADRIISRGLRRISDLPILSEEVPINLSQGNPSRYWLIDPIDGTREFIEKRPSFTVNIALIEHGIPVAGVVYAPALDELYAGTTRAGLRFNRRPATPREWPEERTLVCSRSRPEDELTAFMEKESITRSLPIGSSLKFCWVAFGKAHCYPRFRKLSSWDTAAGHAVALAGGCKVVDMMTGKPLVYSYQQLHIPAFCVLAPDFHLHTFPAQ